MTHIGNIELLQQAPITGVLASRLINPASVLPSLDWAAEQAQNPDATIISGFQSTIEKKILRYLLDGKSNIILVLARSMYKQVPPEYLQALDSGRMLIISLTDQPRTSLATAFERNRYIADKAQTLVFISLNESSSLNTLYNQAKEQKSTILL